MVVNGYVGFHDYKKKKIVSFILSVSIRFVTPHLLYFTPSQEQTTNLHSRRKSSLVHGTAKYGPLIIPLVHMDQSWTECTNIEHISRAVLLHLSMRTILRTLQKPTLYNR